MKIVWTKHATGRQKEWERKLGISRQEVEDLLSKPEQVVPGDLGDLWLKAEEETVCYVYLL